MNLDLIKNTLQFEKVQLLFLLITLYFFYLLSFSFEVFLSNLAWGTYTQYSQSEIQRETMHNRNSTVAIYMLRIKAVLFAFVKFEGSSLTTWGQKIYSCLSCTYFFAAANKKFFLERPRETNSNSNHRKL